MTLTFVSSWLIGNLVFCTSCFEQFLTVLKLRHYVFILKYQTFVCIFCFYFILNLFCSQRVRWHCTKLEFYKFLRYAINLCNIINSLNFSNLILHKQVCIFKIL